MIRSYDDLDEIKCPACDKVLTSQKALPKHCGGCPEWEEKIGIPTAEFDFHKHYQVEMHSPGLVEGRDYVECKVSLEKEKRSGKNYIFTRPFSLDER